MPLPDTALLLRFGLSEASVRKHILVGTRNRAYCDDVSTDPGLETKVSLTAVKKEKGTL